jgi:diguanylate cyclase (GGDEF)-like protein
MSDPTRINHTVDELRNSAFRERSNGNFLYAADLFRQAARLSPDPALALNSQMRRAYCLSAAGQRADAMAIAERVVQRARAEGIHGELIDALAMLVDDTYDQGRMAATVSMLAEATWLLEQLPDHDAPFLVVHNLADSYARCGFHAAAIELFQRAIRLATNEADRQFAAANLTASYHLAGLVERDPAVREQHFRAGLGAAATVLVDDAEREAHVLARAHRSAMLAHVGSYAEAMRDADTARALALMFGMHEEELIALCAQALSRWYGQHDRTALALVDEGQAMADQQAHGPANAILAELRHHILWDTARHDEAREAMQQRIDELEAEVAQALAARWAHVRESIDSRRVELLHESDPLTGLGNAAYLTSLLGEQLGSGSPVCIAVLDIDGFRTLNDRFGYAAGDRVLQELARLLERVSRRGDMVVRLGSDEFAIVLRDASVHDARHVLERVRQQVSVRQWDSIDDHAVTISIGLTVGADVDDSARLLGVAREALFDAKRDGGNRIAHR